MALTIDRNQEAAEYNAGKVDGCVLRMADVETTAWLASHEEVRNVAGNVATSLVRAFADLAGEVSVAVLSDPDDGSEQLLFEILTPAPGREARARLRQYLREQLPEAAAAIRDSLSFSVSSTLVTPD